MTKLYPLATYSRNDEAWPTVLKMPEHWWEDDENPEKFAAFVDDHIVRQAMHCWDNSQRLPGTYVDVVTGVFGAHVRLMVANMAEDANLEEVAQAMGDAWLGMAKRALAVRRANSWDVEE